MTQKNLFRQMVVVFILFITYGVIGLCNTGTIGRVVHALLLALILLFLTVNFHGTRPIRSKVLTVLVLFAIRAIGYEIIGSFLATLFGGGMFSAIFLDALLIFFWVLAYYLLGGSWKKMRVDGKAFGGVVTAFAISFAVCAAVNIALTLVFSPGSAVSLATMGILDYIMALDMLYNVLAVKNAILEAVIVIVLLRANEKTTTIEIDITQED